MRSSAVLEDQRRLSDPLLTGVNEYRALRYVWLVNDRGYLPTKGEVEAYAERPDRGAPESITAIAVAALAGAFLLPGTPGEPVLDYLLRLRWLELREEPSGRIAVSPLGRAVCRAVEARAAAQADDQALVLESGDPFAYPRLLERMAQLPELLVVDPYFRLEQFIDVHELRNVRRVLLGNRISAGERMALTRALPIAPGLEARSTDRVHGRFLIPEAGEVWQIGTSVNAVGNKFSVMAPLSGEVASRVRELHEDLWARAKPLVAPADGDGVAPAASEAAPQPASE